MTSPTPPPSPGPSGPADQPADGGSDLKPWLPAIGLGVVLLVLVAFFFLRSDGEDDAPVTSTSLATTTSTSTSPTATTTSTTPTTAPATVAPTTAPPTTAPPTTAPPTTAAPTAPTNPASAALIRQCNEGDEFACYEVGRLGLAPPPSIVNVASWNGRSDDDVASACQVGLNVTACYVAGSRGLVLGD